MHEVKLKSMILSSFCRNNWDSRYGSVVLALTSHRYAAKRSANAGRTARYGKFYQSMSVTARIDADKIEANYKNGNLEVHLPKAEVTRAKRIAVTAK